MTVIEALFTIGLAMLVIAYLVLRIWLATPKHYRQPLARNRAGGMHEKYTPVQQSIHKGNR